MNENVGKNRFAIVKNHSKETDIGKKVIESAQNSSSIEVLENNGEKVDEKIPEVGESSVKNNDYNNEISQIELSDSKVTTIEFEMPVYLTLSEIKKFKKVNIKKYVNNVVKIALQKDYPQFLKKNDEFLKGLVKA